MEESRGPYMKNRVGPEFPYTARTLQESFVKSTCRCELKGVRFRCRRLTILGNPILVANHLSGLRDIDFPY